MDLATPLGTAESLRYSRHLLLPEVGPAGQRKLRDSRVLLVGAGGLGSPLALYLAAAGVGTLGMVDPDVVDLTNLQRQVLHGTSDVGRPKLDSARDRIREINPHVEVEAHPVLLSSANALEILAGYDVVVDGTEKLREGTKVDVRMPAQPPAQSPATGPSDRQAPQGRRT